MRVLIAHASESSRTRLADAVTRGRDVPVEVVSAADGPEALEVLLQEEPPQVALVDWDLPGIEGPEMCRLVRGFHNGHDTWVIVLAGSAHADSAGEIWRAGGDDCVFTPAPAKLLSERVTKGLCEMAAARTTARAASSRPSLDAVRRPDAEVGDDGVADLTADLQATVDAGSVAEPAELAAGPSQLAAQLVDLDERGAAPVGHATLDAVLARL